MADAPSLLPEDGDRTDLLLEENNAQNEKHYHGNT
jgi:hypothetical protein